MPGRGLLAAVAIAAAVAACSGDERAPRQSPGPVAGEKVSNDDALPSEYPKDELPVPEPSTVIYSAVGQFGVSAYFTSPLAEEEIKRRILATIRSKKWTLHTCRGTAQSPGATTLIVASRPGLVATVAIGFSPASAERIGGKRYSFLISVATRGEPPKPTAAPC
ncbi:MAG: hypothetical protein ACRDJM_11415 [Actinomycetota bacterium]